MRSRRALSNSLTERLEPPEACFLNTAYSENQNGVSSMISVNEVAS